jgi:hypothetical protein
MIMSPKEALQEIKNLFTKFSDEENKPEEKKEEMALTEGKLVDGTKVYYDVQSSEIYVDGADGEKVPAPVGEHELETGEIIVVKEEGKIAEMKEKEDKPEVEIEVEASQEPNAEISAINDIVASLVSKQEQLEKRIADLLEVQKMSAIVINALANESSAEPIQKPASFHQELKSSKEQKIAQLTKVFEARKMNIK